VAPRKARSPKGLWLHVYGIRPPQPRTRLRRIAALLRAENRRAHEARRAWSGALISGPRGGPVTHVVMVSDSARRDERIQLSLEAELKKLAADILIPRPRRVQTGATRPSVRHGKR
jgi:hypothetical protein